jgi:hypothetical protein
MQGAEFPDQFFSVGQSHTEVKRAQHQNSDRFLACHGGSFLYMSFAVLFFMLSLSVFFRITLSIRKTGNYFHA